LKLPILVFSLFWRMLVLYFSFIIFAIIVLKLLILTGLYHFSMSPLNIPTYVSLILALIILITTLQFQINLVSVIFGQKLALTKIFWSRFHIGLSAILCLIALLNWIVAASASIDVWINFKFFGILSILFCGVIILVAFLLRAESRS